MTKFAMAMEVARNAKPGEILFRRTSWPADNMLKLSAGHVIHESTDGKTWVQAAIIEADRDAADWEYAPADEWGVDCIGEIRLLPFHKAKQRLVADPKLSAKRQIWHGIVLKWIPGEWIVGAGMSAGRFVLTDELGGISTFNPNGEHEKHADAEDWVILPADGDDMEEAPKTDPITVPTKTLWTDIVDRVREHTVARRRSWPGQRHVYRGQRNGEHFLFIAAVANGKPEPYSTSPEDMTATDWELITFASLVKRPIWEGTALDHVAFDEPVDDAGRREAAVDFWALMENHSHLNLDQLEEVRTLLHKMGYLPVRTLQEPDPIAGDSIRHRWIYNAAVAFLARRFPKELGGEFRRDSRYTEFKNGFNVAIDAATSFYDHFPVRLQVLDAQRQARRAGE